MAELAFSHVCAHDMDWEDDPDIPGFRQKVLYRDEDTNAYVRLWFVPPDWGKDVFNGEPDRHYHRSVVERAYQLYGDFPHWEFNSVEDLEGDLYIFKRGLFMDRPPGSLHGLLPEPRSQAGAVILYWNSGGGTSIQEPGFDEETVKVPFENDVKLEINTFNPCRLLETDKMAWQAHPDVEGWKIKRLAESGYGADTADLVFIPSDWQPDADHMTVATDADAPWLYAVSGDLSVSLDGAETLLKQDDFLRWTSTNTLTLPDKPVSETGCIALCSGHRLAVKS